LTCFPFPAAVKVVLEARYPTTKADTGLIASMTLWGAIIGQVRLRSFATAKTTNKQQ
jgi:hypothetical protein